MDSDRISPPSLQPQKRPGEKNLHVLAAHDHALKVSLQSEFGISTLRTLEKNVGKSQRKSQVEGRSRLM
jgi:hypothetical protein